MTSLTATTIDVVFGIEPDGFILGSDLAHAHGVGFVPIRKAGKLPAAVTGIDTASGRLEVHSEDLIPGRKALLVGDMCAAEVMYALQRHGMSVEIHGTQVRSG